MVENQHGDHFHIWDQNSNAYNIYRSKGNFFRINIVLRTRVQKWTYFRAIENQRDIFLKVVGFFVKNRQDIRK